MPLKEELIEKGTHFKSETDTEVVAHLLEDAYDGDFGKHLYDACSLKGWGL